MKRRILSILLCFSLIFSLTACSGGGVSSTVRESATPIAEGEQTPSVDNNQNPQPEPEQKPQSTPTVSAKPNNPTVMNTFYRNVIGSDIASDNADVKAVDVKADAMLKKIEDYPDSVSVSGKTYYVSSSGKSSNNGLSASSPKDSYASVRDLLKEGDAVLFNRGDIFRGQLVLKSGVTYGAYGEGIKPRFYGSVDGKAGKWLETGTKGVYTYNKTVQCSNVIFNNGEAIARPVYSMADITKKKYNVYFNGSRISVYSPDGNPGEIFHSIEIVEDYCLFVGGGGLKNVKLQNLCLMYAGIHHLGSLGAVYGLEVEGCVMGYCGGKGLYSNRNTTTLGNSIEFWSVAKDINIHDSYFFQAFDAALTHQGPTTVKDGDPQLGATNYTNIHYENNLIEYCTYDIEAFSCRGIAQQSKSPNGTFTYNDVYVKGNICRYTGWGWGSMDRHDKNVYAHFKYDAEGENNTNIHVKPLYIENNIFDRSRKSVLNIQTPEFNKANMILKNNLFLETERANIFGGKTLKEDYMSVINKYFTAEGNTFKIVG